MTASKQRPVTLLRETGLVSGVRITATIEARANVTY
jgi:hypothetical protein